MESTGFIFLCQQSPKITPQSIKNAPYNIKRHLYSFEYLCDQDPSLTFGDETIKIILNTKGTMDDVSPEMKRLLEYIDGQAASDEFTRELDDAVQSVRRNEKWRLDSVKNKFFTRQICDCSPKFAD